MDEFHATVLEGRQAIRVLDRDGHGLLDKPDEGTGGRPEVQRGELRQLLLGALPAAPSVGGGRQAASARSARAATR